nr:gamma-glutamyltransferase family protein [Halorubrum sp. CBA1125]
MPSPVDTYDSRRSTVRASNGIVATSQPLASQAGIRILREGGNAFDAAVAATATLNVVEPHMTGVGGDVFGLYRTADGEVGALQSIGSAAGGASLDRVRQDLTSDGEDGDEIPLRSIHSITVPGTARGWETTVDHFGNLAFDETLRPAIEYARDGFPVTEVIAGQWKVGEEVLANDAARDTFLLNGSAPDPGDVMRVPELAETFEQLAYEGADAIYEGSIGEEIVDTVQSLGGYLSLNDLADFEPTFVDPVSTTYNGVEVYELPPPNQGLIALEAFNIAEKLGASDHSFMSAEGTHQYVESLKLAFHDGFAYVTDPEFEDVPALHSKEYAAERARSVTEEAGVVEMGNPNAQDSDTVLVTVADGEGNVVAYINSLFREFGSGVVAGDTGIALQNRGSSFSLDPADANCLEPGKRPFHTLIPALARFDTDDWAAFGVMGGYVQPQGHLQVLSAIVDHGLTLQDALDLPRWFYRESGNLAVEARMDPTLVTELARRGHDVTVETPDLFGGGQIARTEGGTLSGATDPRKDGTVGCY